MCCKEDGWNEMREEGVNGIRGEGVNGMLRERIEWNGKSKDGME